MRNSRTSLRSRASSSRSAVVRPVLPFVRSARACATQLRSDDSVTPRSRAADATVLPSSRTSHTAPVLSSSVKLRRPRLPFVSAMVDIVFPFRKMSAKPDQAHYPDSNQAVGIRLREGLSFKGKRICETIHPTLVDETIIGIPFQLDTITEFR